ncbi:MAG TPA: class I SAM-dependent methyltransferase [Pseudolabrys sp.]
MAEIKVTFDAADQYERFMGRWSRAIGEKFIDWIAPPRNARWLDAGCGTGALSEIIVRRCAPAALVGIDPSQAQIDFARKTFPKLDFRVGDAMAMPLPDTDFDAVVSALVIHFITDRAKAFAEMKRVARPGALIAGYLWERSATTDFAPYAPMHFGLQHIAAEPMRSPLVPEASLDGMQASLTAAGYRDIVVTQIEASQSFTNFDEFWEINTLSFHPVGKSVAKLSDAQRGKLHDHMRATLPIAADGTISYPARCIAFKARK